MIESFFVKIHKWSFGSAKSVLDVGCGTGDFMKLMANNRQWKITGIDIHHQSITEAKKLNIYKKFIEGDVIKILEQLKEQKKQYDVIFCSQLIEHLSKRQGEKMLNLFENLAKKRIIIGTPKGYLEQPYEHELHRNKHQKHKSGWEISDFLTRNYKVYGIGLGIVWGEGGLGRKANYFNALAAQFLSFVFSPFSYYLPQIASGLLCVKVKSK